MRRCTSRLISFYVIFDSIGKEESAHLELNNQEILEAVQRYNQGKEGAEDDPAAYRLTKFYIITV